MDEFEEMPLPIGRIARKIGTMRVIPPDLRPDEEVLWSAKASRFQSKFRSVGGKLYLTDRRLLFGRHEIDANFGGQEWDAPLEELVDAKVRGAFKHVIVTRSDGGEERFVVWPPKESAEILTAAFAAALAGDQP
jgi:hypothetical protein